MRLTKEKISIKIYRKTFVRRESGLPELITVQASPNWVYDNSEFHGLYYRQKKQMTKKKKI